MSRVFMDNPSSKYKVAVRAMLELLEEGSDALSRAFAEATADHNMNAFVKKHKIKPAKDGHVCVSRLLGKRCPGATCTSPLDIPGYDHVSEWTKKGKTEVIVSQPYGIGYGVLKNTIEFCEKNGLRADIDTFPSWHFPGSVISVEYRRDDDKAEPH